MASTVRFAGRVCGLVAMLAFAMLAVATPSVGQTIGNASTVRNTVVQVKGAASSPIGSGDPVVRDEIVRTAAESATKLVFKDNTNLAVGPNSTVKLDRFVYAGENSASKVSVNLIKGAFRFTTGESAKRAYEINTPVATIGVRGTVFDVLSQPGRTTVRLVRGQIIVCTRSRSKCTIVSTAGDTVVVTATDVSRAARGGSGRFTFASFCGSDGLCRSTQSASLPRTGSRAASLPPPDTSGPSILPSDAAGAVLCGR